MGISRRYISSVDSSLSVRMQPPRYLVVHTRNPTEGVGDIECYAVYAYVTLCHGTPPQTNLSIIAYLFYQIDVRHAPAVDAG